MENQNNFRRYEDWPINRAKQNLVIYTLVNDENDFTEAREKILGCLHMGEMDISAFTDKKSLLFKMSELLKDGDSVLLLAEPEQYAGLKETLMRALALPVGVDEELSAKLQKSGQDRKLADMPRGARVFMTDDGVNSGFSVRSGKQTIVLLPLDEERADSLLNNGARAFLENFGEDLSLENGARSHSNDPVQRVSRALQRVGKRAAVSGTPTSVFVKNLIDEDESGSAQENFVFSENAQPRGDYSPRDYAVLLAKNAMDEAGTSIGAAVTNVFAKKLGDTDGMFICVAVTNEDKAAGRTLYAKPGENPADFLKTAAAELLVLLSEVTESMPTVAMTTPPVAIYNKPEEKKEPKKKSSGLWITVVILISVILAVVLGLKFSGYFDVPEENNVPTHAPTVTVVTTEPETLLPEYDSQAATEEPSESEEQTSKVEEESTTEEESSSVEFDNMTTEENEVV